MKRPKRFLFESMESFSLSKFNDPPPLVSNLAQGKAFLKHLSEIDSLRARRALTLIMQGLSLPDNGSVFEIGTGVGMIAIELNLRGYKYQGLELVQENVNLWNTIRLHYGLDGEVRLQDICEMESIDQQWDGVFSKWTFEHIHDRTKALRNCFRLLRPGGRLVILDGNSLDPRVLWKMVVVRPFKSKGRSGGLKWLLNREKTYDNYGEGWKGKDEAVRSVYWWRHEITKYGFDLIEASTVGAYHPLTRNSPFWPFLGSVFIVAEKPSSGS